ncbi:hypothetical protein OAA99_01015 [Omnitrophica bacterium]|nr:hypothetical protein [Candidatus Omnitrophota bacterium]
MKKVIMLLLVALFSLPCAAEDRALEIRVQEDGGSIEGPIEEYERPKKTSIGAYRVVRTAPTREEILKDSKPANLSVIDIVVLKQDVIRIGAAKVEVLVNRLTNKVEYVWSPPYKRYVRPQFVMPKAQNLYEGRRI